MMKLLYGTFITQYTYIIAYLSMSIACNKSLKVSPSNAYCHCVTLKTLKTLACYAVLQLWQLTFTVWICFAHENMKKVLKSWIFLAELKTFSLIQ